MNSPSEKTKTSHTPASLSLAVLARELAKTMQCNCDLDNWEPERSTGHSHVCRIHKAAINKATRVTQ